jgi:hypothetical protein
MRASRYAIRDGSLCRDQGVRVPAKGEVRLPAGNRLKDPTRCPVSELDLGE